MFYMPMQFGFGLVSNIPAYQSYNVNVFQVPLAYPQDNPPLPPGTQNVSIFPQHPRDPLSTNWLFGIQQQIAPNTILAVNYTGNKTTHMQAGIAFAALNYNPANSVTQARPLSGFANENVDADALSSTYNALQVQVRHTYGRLNYEVNYTWSHEIDDLVNVFSGWSDPYNPNVDRASGDWDVRQNLTGSVVYHLPQLHGERGGQGVPVRMAGIEHSADSLGTSHQRSVDQRLLRIADTSQLRSRPKSDHRQCELAVRQLQ